MLISCEIDDSVKERESEEVKGGAGSKDGGSVELPRSVEEEVSKDFSKDVLVEGEEGSRSGHGWRRWFLDGK